jgi:tRNA nucleotidyltransferase/poly(A) polymerase
MPLAKQLSRLGLGTVVALSEKAPRVVRVAGKTTLDLAEVEGASLEEDLARRDFTVNAMALELAKAHLIDPFGGQQDLARRRLRLVRSGNLEEDPLRVLRAARFFATHGFEPDPGVTAACRRVAPRLSEAAPERITVELSRLLEAPRVVAALRWAIRTGVLPVALGRPLPASAGRRLASLDAPGVRRLPPGRRRGLRLTLLAAALGVPAGEVESWLSRLRFSREESRSSQRRLQLAYAAEAGSRDEDWRWVVQAGSEGEDALLAASLISSTGAAVARRLARRLATPRPRLKVSGREILDWTGLPPGPGIGALLFELEVEIRAGRIRGRREARAWVRANTALQGGSKSRAAKEM